jgi:hypothetical protein
MLGMKGKQWEDMIIEKKEVNRRGDESNLGICWG